MIHTASAPELSLLRDVGDAHGSENLAREARVSRDTMLRALAGMSVNQATLAALLDAARRLANTPPKAP